MAESDVSVLLGIPFSEFEPHFVEVAPYAAGTLADDSHGTSAEDLPGTSPHSSGSGAEDRSGTFSGGTTGTVS